MERLLIFFLLLLAICKFCLANSLKRERDRERERGDNNYLLYEMQVYFSLNFLVGMNVSSKL
jgi:hypothetical protein